MIRALSEENIHLLKNNKSINKHLITLQTIDLWFIYHDDDFFSSFSFFQVSSLYIISPHSIITAIWWDIHFKKSSPKVGEICLLWHQIHRQTVDQFHFCAPTQEGSCLASSTKTEGGDAFKHCLGRIPGVGTWVPQ